MDQRAPFLKMEVVLGIVPVRLALHVRQQQDQKHVLPVNVKNHRMQQKDVRMDKPVMMIAHVVKMMMVYN